MTFGEPAITAAIGLLGIFAGGLIQAAVARTNQQHERRLALEMRRVEERFRSYTELTRYLMEAEAACGRSIGPFHGTSMRHEHSEKRNESTQPSLPELNSDLASRLSTYGSVRLDLIFAAWNLERSQQESFQAMLDLADAFRGEEEQIPAFTAQEREELHWLVETANKRAGGLARRVLRQIQAELQGEASWRRTQRRIRGWLKERMRAKAREAELEHFEEVVQRYRRRLDELVEATQQAIEAAEEEVASIRPDADASSVPMQPSVQPRPPADADATRQR
ncbi:hypothetical protein [Micromonospora ureilytica]|uniref:hypothetical protein n=1 Tax=Micromonospora ureilytica TaxID=709868 RepID=UPI000F5F2CDA|nr:hypothetical protein [Micromonospora ureilytica]